MLTPHDFHEIVSGRRSGISAALWRVAMAAAEPLYRLGVAWKNRKYNRPDAVTDVERPVISVGNLTVGGTGKTPMVESIARYYRNKGLRVALVSRGYGAVDGGMNDEALELEQKLPDVPHVQDPDRIAAARIAIDELETELIVLDDGFQHRRIGRDLDIVMLDAVEPFGYSRLLPRGLLREPIASLLRADVIALSRADMVDADRRAEIQQRVRRENKTALWVEVAHRPKYFMTASQREVPLDELKGKTAFAFCGLGNPSGFMHSLAECDVDVRESKEFPDHHRYSRDDIEQLRQWATSAAAPNAIVCTHKDLVKIGVDSFGSIPLYALVVGLEFQVGEQEFNILLDAKFERAKSMR